MQIGERKSVKSARSMLRLAIVAVLVITMMVSVTSITAYAETVTVSTVKFEPNGGTVGTGSINVNNGDAIGPLPTVSRTGHTFLGWYTDAESGIKISESTKVTENMTLYAHWKANNYTIKFNVNGGKKLAASKAEKTVSYGKTFGKLPIPKRTGYKFLGWYTKASSGSKITASSKVGITNTQKYYAHWKPVTVTIILVPNVKGMSSIKIKATYGKKYQGDFSNPIRLANLFTGWHKGSKSGKVAKITGKSTFTKNTKLYASWKTASADDIARDIAKRAKKKKGDYNKITEASKQVYRYTTLCSYEYTPPYDKPEGVFVKGVYTCAGSTRAMGLVLTKMGYSWDHVNANLYTHQWNKVYTKSGVMWADAHIGEAGFGKHPIE